MDLIQTLDVAAARQALALDTATGKAWRDLAWALMAAGQREDSCHCLARAFQIDQSLIGPALLESDTEHSRIAMDALARHNPRMAQITRPSAFLGPAGPDLDPDIEAIIKARLNRAAAEAEDKCGAPPDFQNYGLPPSSPEARVSLGADAWPVPPLRLALVFQGDGQGDFGRNDLWFHCASAARACGLTVQSFDGAGLLYPNPDGETVPGLFESLDQRLAAFDPDIVLVEANFKPGPGRLDRAQLQHWQNAKFTLVFLVGDTDEDSGVPVNYWHEMGDLAVIFQRSSLTTICQNPDKILVWPALPMIQSIVTPSKDIDFIFVGRLYRGREIFLHFLTSFDLGPTVLGRGMTGPPRLDMDGYIDAMARARLTFNTGILAGNRGIVTGRLFEAMANHCVVLEEASDAIPPFLLPFAHYVPVNNAHEAVIYTQYFKRHPDDAERIAKMALNFVSAHLPPQRFFYALAQRRRPDPIPRG